MIDKIHQELLKLRSSYNSGVVEESQLTTILELLNHSDLCLVKSGSFPIGPSQKSDPSPKGIQVSLLIDQFSVPYNPNLGFDWLFYSEVKVSEYCKMTFPSQALPVRVQKCSPGFETARSVAIFPENFVSIPAHVSVQPVYYFIDKFVHRWFQITVPAIKQFLSFPADFESLLNRSHEELLSVSATWVSMHEHFHEQGPMPIRNSLQIKSSRSTAALEELRVDLEVIRSCLNSTTTFGQHVAHFVFLERFLRYQLESTAQDDYDARGSVALFRYLLKVKAVRFDDSRIVLDQTILWKALDNLLDRINLSEQVASQRSSIKEARGVLSSIIDEYFILDLTQGTRKYNAGVSLTSKSWGFA